MDKSIRATSSELHLSDLGDAIGGIESDWSDDCLDSGSEGRRGMTVGRGWKIVNVSGAEEEDESSSISNSSSSDNNQDAGHLDDACTEGGMSAFETAPQTTSSSDCVVRPVGTTLTPAAEPSSVCKETKIEVACDCGEEQESTEEVPQTDQTLPSTPAKMTQLSNGCYDSSEEDYDLEASIAIVAAPFTAEIPTIPTSSVAHPPVMSMVCGAAAVSNSKDDAQKQDVQQSCPNTHSFIPSSYSSSYSFVSSSDDGGCCRREEEEEADTHRRMQHHRLVFDDCARHFPRLPSSLVWGVVSSFHSPCSLSHLTLPLQAVSALDLLRRYSSMLLVSQKQLVLTAARCSVDRLKDSVPQFEYESLQRLVTETLPTLIDVYVATSAGHFRAGHGEWGTETSQSFHQAPCVVSAKRLCSQLSLRFNTWKASVVASFDRAHTL